MHNIKEIRENPDKFKENLKKRQVDIDVKKIISLDEKNRKLIQQKEILEKEKKDISKSKDKSLFEKSKEISKKISQYSKEQSDIKNDLNQILESIPNVALEDVPVGKDETFNKEVTVNGKLPEFKFKPKSHYELGEKLNMLDFDLATKNYRFKICFC